MPQPDHAVPAPVIYIHGSDQDREFLQALERMLGSALGPARILISNVPGTFSLAPEMSRDKADILLLLINQQTLSIFKALRTLPQWLTLRRPEQVMIILRPPLRPQDLPMELRPYRQFDFTSEATYAESTLQLQRLIDERLQGRPEFLQLQSEKGAGKTVPATHALLKVLVLARRLHRERKPPVDFSFSALLSAFTMADDAVSQWFSDYVRQAGLDNDSGHLLRGSGIDPGALDGILQHPYSRQELEEALQPNISTSAMLNEAISILKLISAKPDDASAPMLDVHHLMAAYIYRPGNNEQSLEKNSFNRAEWSSAFLNQMAWLHPEELAGWKAIHRQAFPSHPILLEAEGPSTHIATDHWTVEDTLGYDAYAYAIYRFMTHSQTRAPLTVSIQAPWGGGKTSLMRMIQKEMDPAAVRKQESAGADSPLTLQEVLEEIDSSLNAPSRQLPSPAPRRNTGKPQRLTVWFNAWKYESANQVWAGLVDAVTQQVAARLPLKERERFWLQLNLKRVDVNAIRQKVRLQLLDQFWNGVRKGLIGLGGLLLVGITTWATGGLAALGWSVDPGTLGLAISTAGGALTLLANAVLTWLDFATEPAAASLGQYLKVPDYSKELGFIHHAEVDLRRVLASIPVENKPVVIFIDDLDRCSPQNVAKVVEAVNLFLAGDFQDCMFVLGMDTEMVAAALQCAHKDLLTFLPSDTSTPLGWRFMDKFVQLPFVIPPPESQSIHRLTRSLFNRDEHQPPMPEVEKLARATAERASSRKGLRQAAKRASKERGYDESQLQGLLETFYERIRLDEGIARFTDRSEEMRQVIATAIPYFQGNPRELKRFVNAFRFHYFVWYAHRARGLKTPSLEQLVRWTVLSMKWPAVARWLRRGSEPQATFNQAGASGPATSRLQAKDTASLLRCLESSAREGATLKDWSQKVRTELPHLSKETPWLDDEGLFRFFQAEGSRTPESERLSQGSGKGLW